MEKSNLYAVILAGGSGSRLWPLSRELYPKQLIKLSGDNTTFQSTFTRLSSLFPQKNIVTVANTKHSTDIKIQLNELKNNTTTQEDYKVLIEPVGRNTAPAIALSTLYIQQEMAKEGSDPIILVAPSDHLIQENDQFIEALEKGVQLAEEGYIVTFGIVPDRADTGYGYLQTYADNEISAITQEAFKVKEFKEKPNKETAEEYLKQGNYFWNGGIFMFKASTMLNEMEKYASDIFLRIREMRFKDTGPTVSYTEYVEVPDISIDYAIMEKSDLITLIPLDCGWNDLGSWEAIYDVSEKDDNNNFISGNAIDIDSQNSLVYGTSKLVTTIGVKDTVVVETDDAILVCDKSRTQDVKKIYNQLKDQNNNCYLTHSTVYRPWGFYTVLNKTDGYQIKIISVNPGAKLSYQMHYHRNEHWSVVTGTAKVIKDDVDFFLKPGDSIDIPATVKHSLQNPGKIPLKIIEIQMGAYLEEDDIVRFEDMYGRAEMATV